MTWPVFDAETIYAKALSNDATLRKAMPRARLLGSIRSKKGLEVMIHYSVPLPRQVRPSRYFARLSSHDAESDSLRLCTAHFLLRPSDPAVTSNSCNSDCLPRGRVMPVTAARFTRHAGQTKSRSTPMGVRSALFFLYTKAKNIAVILLSA